MKDKLGAIQSNKQLLEQKISEYENMLKAMQQQNAGKYPDNQAWTENGEDHSQTVLNSERLHSEQDSIAPLPR